MHDSSTKTQDPRFKYPQPPFPAQKQSLPGKDSEMQPKADHGEASYKGSGKLKDRVALITGGDSGIGRAIALAYAREGADVVIAYKKAEDDATVTAELVTAAGRKALCVAGDITDEKVCIDLVQQTVKKFGRLDILVNNAAYQTSHQKLEDFPSDQFERVFRTNVFAPFYLAKAAMPHLQPGASIINTVSIQAFDPSAMLLDYASSKSALTGFTKALAKLAIAKGVRVNGVAPGPVWTPFIPATMPAEMVANFGKDTPIGRPAQPAEMAPIYVLLASQEGSYLTGEIYGAVGGSMPF